MRVRKICNALSYLSILSAIVALLVYFYWSFFPYKVLVFQDAKFPVVNPVVKKGTSLKYVSNYCKYMGLPALVTRTFNNQLIFSIPTIITNQPTGCHKITVQIDIPHELPAGEFHLVNTYQFEVNPIRKIIITEKTENFTVTE